MGNESYQSDEREDKDLSESKHEKAVESGRKNQGESLRELYRSVCTRAHQAHGLSKKKDIERACDEYEASLNMISDAEKRSDLNEHFRELFEKARAEIEKHYKRTLEKMLEHEEWVTDKRENSEAPLIRPSPTEDGESPEKAGDGGEGSEGVIRIGEERPDDVRNTQVQDEGKTALSRKISEERGEAPSNQFSGSGSGRTRVSHREEPILEEGHDDATSTQAGMSIKDLLVDHTDQEKQTRPEQVPEQTSTHPPSKSSAEPVRYKQITKQNDEQALLPVLLRRFNSSSIFKTRQRKIAAALVAVMLLLLVLVALSSDTEKMTVQIPSKKTGDRAEYDVKGSLSADSETTFETTIGLLSGFDIQFQGFLIQQVNDTSTVKDGLDESHKALEEYLSHANRTEAELREELQPLATKRVTRSLVLGKTAGEEKIEVSDSEVEAEIEEITKAAENKDELEKVLSTPQSRESIKQLLLTRKTMQRLVEIAKGLATEVDTAADLAVDRVDKGAEDV